MGQKRGGSSAIYQPRPAPYKTLKGPDTKGAEGGLNFHLGKADCGAFYLGKRESTIYHLLCVTAGKEWEIGRRVKQVGCVSTLGPCGPNFRRGWN